MLTKMMDGLSSKLADQWISTMLTPAFAFWAGGFLAWLWHFGWASLEQRFTSLSIAQLVTVLIGTFFVVATSASLVERFNLTVLRLLEGYWPHWLQWPRKWLIDRRASRLDRLNQCYQALAVEDLERMSPQEFDEYIALDHQLRRMPALPHQLMPTALGNILRSAELRPKEKYGLDAVICWPRLWLLLPEDVKKELTDARAVLDTATSLWSWGMLFLIWTVWAWWAIAISLIVVLFAYNRMLSSAEIYSDILDSVFDLYRIELYKSLRWPVPENPFAERQIGAQITDYLWCGSDASIPVFTKKE